MYSMLFRSRWVALLWVGLMAAYAVFSTSGSNLLGFVTPPPVSSEQTKLSKQRREEAKFQAWAAQDSRDSGNRDYNSPDESGSNQGDYYDQ